MSIKVLVIANYRPTVAVRSEAEIFIALQKDFGYDITIMTFADSEYVERFKSVGIRVIDFHPEAKFKPAYIRRIREELCTGNYQVMHLFNNKAMINGLLAAINIPVKVAIYRGYTGNINWWDPFMYLKYLSPRVDKIVCLVEAIRVLIRKNLFFNKDKAITINKGHDVNWYNNTVPVDLGLPQNAFKITCVANIRPMKGLIDDSPIKNQIINLGYRKDVLNVVKASDAFVLPSIKGEAITKSVIEAMCLEVAPIITDIPGNVGLVIDGDSGLVVPPHNAKALADAMVKLSSDKDLTIRLGKKAREHIDKNLNTRDTVKAFDAMYKDLVAS
ncbi:MAG: glycosyltransferase [Cytophagia bacterium]|nr:glycosyltransferase [Cytophagia bacterium]